MNGRSRRLERICCGMALALLAAGCGTQLSHEEIVTAHGGGAGVGAATGRGSTTGATGAGTAATDSSGAATAPGATEGSAGSGSAATPGGGGGGGATGASAGTGAAGANGSEVVIGSIGTYSGVVGAIFEGGREAIQAWAQDVNARGGLNGHPVRLLIADDGGDPSRALTIARDMVERQGAIAFVANNQPLSLSGIRPYLEQNGIPLIGGDVTLQDWNQSPVIFPQGTAVEVIGPAALSLMAQHGASRQAILFCGESPSCELLTRLIPAGVQPVYTAQISLAQVDFTGECLRAKDAGAQGIFVAADSNTVSRVARSCRQQGLDVQYGTAAVAVGPQLADDPNVDGLVAPVAVFPWFLSDTPAFAEYANAMATYASGVELSAVVAGQWTSGKLLERAAAGFDADPTSAELLAALGAIQNETLGGLSSPLSFVPGGPSPVNACYFVVQVSGGGWTAPNGAAPVC